MKVLGIIPARWDSTRFPGKPLCDIMGKPMVQRVWEAASRAGLDDVVVATDDRRIADAVKGFGGKVWLDTRPIGSGSERVAVCASCYFKYTDMNDVLVNIQGDEPGIRGDMIEYIVSCFVNAIRYNSHPSHRIPYAATAAFPSDDREIYNDPNVVKVVCDNYGYAMYFSRSPIPGRPAGHPGLLFNKHLGIYAYKAGVLWAMIKTKETWLEKVEQLEQLRLLEHGHAIMVVPVRHDSFAVDTPGDLVRFRTWYNMQKDPPW